MRAMLHICPGKSHAVQLGGGKERRRTICPHPPFLSTVGGKGRENHQNREREQRRRGLSLPFSWEDRISLSHTYVVDIA